MTAQNVHPTPAMRLLPLAACLTVACAGSSSLAHGAVSTLQVLNCNDHGSDSLRAAVTAATDDTVIDLTALACSTITLTTGAILINHAVANLTLNGPTDHVLAVDGSYLERVLVHNGEGILTIDHLTITHGSYTSGYYGGGCIYALGSVTLQHSTVSNCKVQLSNQYFVYGGGIFTQKNLVLTNSALSGNQVSNGNFSYSKGGGAFVQGSFVATSSSIHDNVALTPSVGDFSISRGGGVFAEGPVQVYGTAFWANEAKQAGAVYAHATAAFSNSTVSGNNATQHTGGILCRDGLTLDNTTVAFNTQAGTEVAAGVTSLGASLVVSSSIIANNISTLTSNAYDLFRAIGSSISGGNNLIMSSNNTYPAGTLHGDPKLGALGYHGGPTPTHTLRFGSPAIDTGANTHTFDFDQRGTGYPRKIGANPDIGAFELNTIDLIFFDGFD